MNKEETASFTLGGILFVLGLVELYNRHFESALFMCGIGIVFMASANKEFALQLWNLFFGGFVKLLKSIFGFIFDRD